MDGENLSNDECVICNNQYDTSTHIEFRLPCNHILCKSCMFELCKTSNTCPFCRMEFQVSIKQKDNIEFNKTKNSEIQEIREEITTVNNELSQLDSKLLILSGKLKMAEKSKKDALDGIDRLKELEQQYPYMSY